MHPYADRPDQAFWNRSVADRPWLRVAFDSSTRGIVGPETRIATAGSCFASNLLRALPGLGLRPYFVEQPPDYFTDDEIREHGYREFTARYGNVYTARQLRQLVEQALGHAPMIEELVEHDGAVYDLLRPHVRPGGFVNLDEARADRAYHLGCVRQMLVECDVFVFTLGLTEAWVNGETGTVYPVCPGTAAGTYDPDRHLPVNFDYVAIVDDLRWVIDAVHEVNPGLQWIITVSPVHLVATHTANDVIVASTYSKSVLRAVAGAVEQSHDQVNYFPSFEIISAAQSFGQYLDANLRDVTDRGIGHVMELFDRVYVERSSADETTVDGNGRSSEQTGATMPPDAGATASSRFDAVAEALQAECDELLNDPG